VLFDELLVVRLVLDDVIGDEVQDGQIGLGGEYHTVVGQLKAAVLISGEHMHFAAGLGQAGIRMKAPTAEAMQ